MTFNLIIIIGTCCLFISLSSLFWIKWRKIGAELLVIIIAILFIYSFGIVKYSIIGSIGLNSINFDSKSSLTILKNDSEFVTRGDIILESIKIWSKKLRGKKPIYVTSGGSQMSVDSIGDEKSIKLFKRF